MECSPESYQLCSSQKENFTVGLKQLDTSQSVLNLLRAIKRKKRLSLVSIKDL